ncbi:hypothetical protein KEM52_002467, partial [Ascosphaera acerosa]
ELEESGSDEDGEELPSRKRKRGAAALLDDAELEMFSDGEEEDMPLTANDLGSEPESSDAEEGLVDEEAEVSGDDSVSEDDDEGDDDDEDEDAGGSDMDGFINDDVSDDVSEEEEKEEEEAEKAPKKRRKSGR